MIWTLLFACLPAPPPAPSTSAPSGLAAELASRPLAITRHGACRMACRHIDEAEIRETLAEGKHIPERTRLDGECPSHAFEHTTADGQEVRIVFAACSDETRLVTAIDLGREWPCDCN